MQWISRNIQVYYMFKYPTYFCYYVISVKIIAYLLAQELLATSVAL